MELLIFAFLCWCAFAVLGWYIANQKGRPDIEGILLGFLFGPLGALIAALMPTIPDSNGPKQRSRGRDRVAWMPDYRENWDEPKVPSNDGIDDQVLDYLGVDTSSKSKSRGLPDAIDVEGIAQAAKDNQARKDAERRARRDQARRDIQGHGPAR